MKDWEPQQFNPAQNIREIAGQHHDNAAQALYIDHQTTSNSLSNLSMVLSVFGSRALA
ncbi:MAG: hypothetical protein P8Q84_09225 [Luminiphilus sp.]|nr:hypothetical protein [Luminiphilus sp.]